MPILLFLLKHSQQLHDLLSKGGTPEGSHIVVDIATALLPVVKKNWPALNANGLLDDALSLLKEQLSTQA